MRILFIVAAVLLTGCTPRFGGFTSEEQIELQKVCWSMSGKPAFREGWFDSGPSLFTCSSQTRILKLKPAEYWEPPK